MIDFCIELGKEIIKYYKKNGKECEFDYFQNHKNDQVKYGLRIFRGDIRNERFNFLYVVSDNDKTIDLELILLEAYDSYYYWIDLEYEIDLITIKKTINFDFEELAEKLIKESEKYEKNIEI